MKTLAISLFGAPTFALDGTFVEGFNSNKTRALLSYIALADAPCPRTVLAGLLWSDLPEEKALTNLRKSILNLRKLFGDFLLISSQSLWLNFERPIWIDVRQFAHQNARREHAADLAEAVSLYRGDFLVGLFVKDAAVFEEWADQQREHFREVVMETLLRLIGKQRAAFDLETTAVFARRLLQMEPWREAAHRHLMTMFSQQGQPAKAEKQFQACRAALQEQLGVDVSPETERLRQRIQQVHRHFPAKVQATTTPFIGRIRERMALEQLLAREDVRLVTLFANGGMGKSRLSLALAERFVRRKGGGRYWDGIFFVPLAPITDVEHIVPTIASTVSFQLQSQSQFSPEKQLLQFLKEKAALIILDNFEHLLEGAPLLNKIIQTCPEVDLLVSSRERLKLYEEQLFTLWGLDEADSLPDSQGTTSYAAELFLTTVRRLQPTFQPSDADLTHISDICEAVQGMPLALELAASWADTLSLPEIAAELRAGLAILATNLRNFPERHRSILILFDSSWKRLREPEKQVLAVLSLFRGGFDKQALAAVTQANRFTLAQLLSRALLHFDAATQRYQMHELLRQFAAEKLAARADAHDMAMRQFRQHYLALAAMQQASLFGNRPSHGLQTIALDIDNIRLAWQQAIASHDWPLIKPAILPMSEFFALQGWRQEAVQLFEQTARAIEDHAPEQTTLVGLLLVHKAKHFEQMGALREGLSDVDLGLQWLEMKKNEAGLALGYLVKAQIVTKLGEFVAAQRLMAVGISLAEATGSDLVLIQALNFLGIEAARVGNFEAAVSHFEGSMALADAVQFVRIVASIEANLGVLYCLHGAHENGRLWYEKAFASLEHFYDPYLENHILNNLGQSFTETGDYEKAADYFAASISGYGQLGAKLGLINSQNGLGRVQLEQRLPTVAKKTLVKALRRGAESQAVSQMLESVVWLGICLAREGELAVAALILQHAIHHAGAEQVITVHGQSILDALKTQLSPAAWEKASTKGRQISLDLLVETLLKRLDFVSLGTI